MRRLLFGELGCTRPLHPAKISMENNNTIFNALLFSQPCNKVKHRLTIFAARRINNYGHPFSMIDTNHEMRILSE